MKWVRADVGFEMGNGKLDLTGRLRRALKMFLDTLSFTCTMCEVHTAKTT